MTLPIFIPDYIRMKGFALYCDLDAEEGWSDALQFLSDAGLCIEWPQHPDKAYVVDDLGYLVDITVAEFRQRAARGDPLTFRVWGDGQDMLCCYVASPAKRAYEHYYFTDLENGRVGFVRALARRFETNARRGRVVLAVDWAPISEDFDWNGLLQERTGYSGSAPELLAVPKGHEPLLRLDMQEFTRIEFSDHVVVARRTGDEPGERPVEFDPRS
jgi:hypothetical protein